jgi:hypothetical protein
VDCTTSTTVPPKNRNGCGADRSDVGRNQPRVVAQRRVTDFTKRNARYCRSACTQGRTYCRFACVTIRTPLPRWELKRARGHSLVGLLARRPYACLMHVLVVHGANVVGSRPDGWWHDRAGAARRLQEKLSAANLPYGEVVLVIEGEAKRGNPAGQKGRVSTVHAPGLGDDAVVEEVNRQVGAGDGRAVSVVTADRLLRERIEAAGATAKGPGWLLGQV